MLYQLSYSRGKSWCHEITPKNRISNLAATQPISRVARIRSTMATPPLPPATNRLVGLLLLFSGFLLGLGLLLKIGVMLYRWNTGVAELPVGLLAINLLGLMAGGLLMRWGLRLRRGTSTSRSPSADEIL